jgi:phosphoserine phosphatase
MEARAKSSGCCAYFDFDNTVISVDSILYWLRFYYGKKPLMRFLLVINWAGLVLYSLGLISKSTLKRIFLMHIAYEKPEDLDKMAKEFVEKELVKRIYPGILERMQAHSVLGHQVVLISASSVFYLKHLQPYLPPCIIIGTEFSAHGKGYIRLPKYREEMGNLRESNKLTAIKMHPDLPDSGENCFSYSDDVSDKYLLNYTAFPYCVHPNQRLSSMAEKNNWPILLPGGKGPFWKHCLSSLALLLFAYWPGSKGEIPEKGSEETKFQEENDGLLPLKLYLDFKNRVNAQAPEDRYEELHASIFADLPGLKDILSDNPDIFQQASRPPGSMGYDEIERQVNGYFLLRRESGWTVERRD